MSAIPSNANQGTLPNWALASTTFDTTHDSGKQLVFWIVAWGVDDSGKMIAEQAGHGLTQDPQELSSTQITDALIENYSNNVGARKALGLHNIYVRVGTACNETSTAVLTSRNVS